MYQGEMEGSREMGQDGEGNGYLLVGTKVL